MRNVVAVNGAPSRLSGRRAKAGTDDVNRTLRSVAGLYSYQTSPAKNFPVKYSRSQLKRSRE